MSARSIQHLAAGITLFAALTIGPSGCGSDDTPDAPAESDAPAQPDDAAIRANNRAVGLMGRFEYRKARRIFDDLAQKHPQWHDVRVNNAIATLNRQEEGDEERALDILADVLESQPDDVRGRYLTGLIELYLGRPEEAVEHFRFVAEQDPADAYAAYYVGQSLTSLGRYEASHEWYDFAIEQDPYLRSAYYGKAQALQRTGDDDEADRLIETFTRLENNPRSRLVEFVYTRQGEKAMAKAVNPAGAAPAPPAPPQGPLFRDPVPLAELPDDSAYAWRNADDLDAGTITGCDINNSGRLDIFVTGGLTGPDGHGNAVLLQDEGGSFDIQPDHPLTAISDVRAALWGDYDNNGLVDVYLCRNGPNQLWRQTEPGQWRNITDEAGVAGGVADTVDGAFVDADHDGDLDLFVVNVDAPNELYINNLDGTFRAIAEEHNISGGERPARQAVVANLDEDLAADLFVVNESPPHEAYHNKLLWEYAPADGFNELAQRPLRAMVPGDVDADGLPDLLIADDTGRIEQWSPDETGQWSHAETLVDDRGPAIERMALADLTGDGHLDLLSASGSEWRVHRLPSGDVLESHNTASPRAWTPFLADPARGPAMVGYNADGRLSIWHAGNGRHDFAAFTFTGRDIQDEPIRSNASGIGTRAAFRNGRTWTIIDTYRLDSGPGQGLQPIAVGLGGAQRIDFVSIDWSNGIYQSEVDFVAGKVHEITQTQRVLSSCPVLFAWDGEAYSFVSDVLGVGGIGFAVGKGEYAPPRPWENFLIPHDAIIPGDDGRYRLKLGEPMEEVLYLDTARLVAYDLPPGWRMTLDERMQINPPDVTGKPRFYRNLLLPSNAENDRGDDITETVLQVDAVAAPTGPRDTRFHGRLINDHVLTLEFDQPLDGVEGEPILIMDGWVEYPYSQTQFAAWQADADYRAPTLEVRDATGEWHVVHERFGYPAGMPRQASVPIDNLPLGADALRLTTNQEIYWDRLAVAFTAPSSDVHRHELKMRDARLSRVGFPQRTDHPQRYPFYDYADRAPLWDTRHQSGRYTRFGPILELIRERNDALAIVGPGEEIHMEFEGLTAELPDGWTRRYVLELNGWCKDMDRFTRNGRTLAPLPGRGDNRDERKQLHEQYNTRFMSGR